MKKRTLTIVVFMLTAMVHGWATEAEENFDLNGNPPEWLKFGEPIKVYPSKEKVDPSMVRSRSGDIKHTRNKVTILNRNIEVTLPDDFPITLGVGASLSPDGTKLIINSGDRIKAFEIRKDGSYHPMEIDVPHVTYDTTERGWISNWSWIDNETLMGEAEITDRFGHITLESRIYLYNVKTKILAQLDLSAFRKTHPDGVSIAGIGKDLNSLQFGTGEAAFKAKADMRSPLKVRKSKSPTPAPKTATP